MINFNFLQEIRKFELQRAIAHIPPGSHLLELGAGAGWQSKWLSEAGFIVSAIDLDNTEYLTHQEYPVVVYDGVHIPFPDAHFDFVFSSNVMEHVLDLTTMHSEICRVLKPDGIALHILPSTAWRFWTSLTHPLEVLRQQYLFSRSAFLKQPLAVLRALLSNPFPPRHGERGNTTTELYFFSSLFWHRNFQRNGFSILLSQPVGLFYTGHFFKSSAWPIALRQKLARIMGSACRLYLLKKAPTPKP